MKEQLEYLNIFDAIADSPSEAIRLKAESDRLLEEREIAFALSEGRISERATAIFGFTMRR